MWQAELAASTAVDRRSYRNRTGAMAVPEKRAGRPRRQEHVVTKITSAVLKNGPTKLPAQAVACLRRRGLRGGAELPLRDGGICAFSWQARA